jgi:hypothetical protein
MFGGWTKWGFIVRWWQAIRRRSRSYKLEVAIADFWCAMIADDLRSLRTWDTGRGGTLGQWLMVLAAYACKAKLRQPRAVSAPSATSSRYA